MQPDSFRSSVKSMAVPLNVCLLASSVDLRSINGYRMAFRLKHLTNRDFAKNSNLFCNA